jgi:hypothetical protein
VISLYSNQPILIYNLILIKDNSILFLYVSLLFQKGDFGPFKINQIVEVPLWLAIELKKKNKCRVITPEWLSIEKL